MYSLFCSINPFISPCADKYHMIVITILKDVLTSGKTTLLNLVFFGNVFALPEPLRFRAYFLFFFI